MLKSLPWRIATSRRLRPYLEAGLLGMSSRLPIGTNVFERDWDLLVVLDTCRADALREVEPEFAFVEDVETIWSLGSSTREWSANTFTTPHRDAIAETAYVCANVRVKQTLENGGAAESELAARVADWDTVSPSDFAVFDWVAGYAPRDPYGGLVPPDFVTDRAVHVSRSRSPDRMIVHYIEPHNPYRANPIRENRPIRPREHRPFRWLRNGGDPAVAWDSYVDELRWVLEHVDVLLKNVDAERAVISADHGDLFGSMGLYSHPTGVPHPNLRRVPWMETTASDGGTYEPHMTPRDETEVEEGVLTQLEHLGYR